MDKDNTSVPEKSAEIKLNYEQERAFDKLCAFVEDDVRVFILRGYAGTGKTTLMKKFIKKLMEKSAPYHLLASTGRAAKILSNITETEDEATTVHSLIYTFVDFNQDIDQIISQREKNGIDKSGRLVLVCELLKIVHDEYYKTRFYIVDEASMISDKKGRSEQAIFGSGKLLSDLFEHDTKGKFIFVGDPCQLPPVNQNTSPALDANYIRTTFDMTVDEAELHQIMRQQDGNDIVLAAQKIRELALDTARMGNSWTRFPIRGYRRVHIVPYPSDLYRLYIEDIQRNGYNACSFIAHSNKLCDSVTKLVRPQLGICSSRIEVHDLLLVTQNNNISGLRNGDQVEVVEIGQRQTRAGLTFVNVKVKELFTEKTYSQLMIEEIIYANQTNLSQPQQKELFIDYAIRMKRMGFGQESKLFKEGLMNDPYLNALRCVYGFVLTCHKAQGGEWERVYIDVPRYLSSPKWDKQAAYQWFYTALTRAKEDVFIVDNMNFVY